MTSNFRHVALIGKYQASSAGAIGESSRQALDGIARFLQHQGCSVAIEAETASNTGFLHHPSPTTDIPFDTYQATLPPMLEGDYEEDSRPLIQACVMRAGQVVFEALAMNDVV